MTFALERQLVWASFSSARIIWYFYGWLLPVIRKQPPECTPYSHYCLVQSLNLLFIIFWQTKSSLTFVQHISVWQFGGNVTDVKPMDINHISGINFSLTFPPLFVNFFKYPKSYFHWECSWISVLYFLHSTSVLSFYIDVVLTLSMCNGKINNTMIA